MNRVHVLRALVAFIFAGAGLMKLTGSENAIAHFAEMGLPPWMVFVVGGAELACAVMLFLPNAFVVGILGMLAIMVGATATMVMNGELPTPPVITATLIILLWRWQNREATTGGA